MDLVSELVEAGSLPNDLLQLMLATDHAVPTANEQQLQRRCASLEAELLESKRRLESVERSHADLQSRHDELTSKFVTLYRVASRALADREANIQTLTARMNDLIHWTSSRYCLQPYTDSHSTIAAGQADTLALSAAPDNPRADGHMSSSVSGQDQVSANVLPPADADTSLTPSTSEPVTNTRLSPALPSADDKATHVNISGSMASAAVPDGKNSISATDAGHDRLDSVSAGDELPVLATDDRQNISSVVEKVTPSPGRDKRECRSSGNKLPLSGPLEDQSSSTVAEKFTPSAGHEKPDRTSPGDKLPLSVAVSEQVPSTVAEELTPSNTHGSTRSANKLPSASREKQNPSNVADTPTLSTAEDKQESSCVGDKFTVPTLNDKPSPTSVADKRTSVSRGRRKSDAVADKVMLSTAEDGQNSSSVTEKTTGSTLSDKPTSSNVAGKRMAVSNGRQKSSTDTERSMLSKSHDKQKASIVDDKVSVLPTSQRSRQDSRRTADKLGALQEKQNSTAIAGDKSPLSKSRKKQKSGIVGNEVVLPSSQDNRDSDSSANQDKLQLSLSEERPNSSGIIDKRTSSTLRDKSTSSPAVDKTEVSTPRKRRRPSVAPTASAEISDSPDADEMPAKRVKLDKLQTRGDASAEPTSASRGSLLTTGSQGLTDSERVACYKTIGEREERQRTIGLKSAERGHRRAALREKASAGSGINDNIAEKSATEVESNLSSSSSSLPPVKKPARRVPLVSEPLAPTLFTLRARARMEQLDRQKDASVVPRGGTELQQSTTANLQMEKLITSAANDDVKKSASTLGNLEPAAPKVVDEGQPCVGEDKVTQSDPRKLWDSETSIRTRSQQTPSPVVTLSASIASGSESVARLKLSRRRVAPSSANRDLNTSDGIPKLISSDKTRTSSGSAAADSGESKQDGTLAAGEKPVKGDAEMPQSVAETEPCSQELDKSETSLAENVANSSQLQQRASTKTPPSKPSSADEARGVQVLTLGESDSLPSRKSSVVVKKQPLRGVVASGVSLIEDDVRRSTANSEADGEPARPADVVGRQSLGAKQKKLAVLSQVAKQKLAVFSDVARQKLAAVSDVTLQPVAMTTGNIVSPADCITTASLSSILPSQPPRICQVTGSISPATSTPVSALCPAPTSDKQFVRPTFALLDPRHVTSQVEPRRVAIETVSVATSLSARSMEVVASPVSVDAVTAEVGSSAVTQASLVHRESVDLFDVAIAGTPAQQRCSPSDNLSDSFMFSPFTDAVDDPACEVDGEQDCDKAADEVPSTTTTGLFDSSLYGDGQQSTCCDTCCSACSCTCTQPSANVSQCGLKVTSPGDSDGKPSPGTQRSTASTPSSPFKVFRVVDRTADTDDDSLEESSNTASRTPPYAGVDVEQVQRPSTEDDDDGELDSSEVVAGDGETRAEMATNNHEGIAAGSGDAVAAANVVSQPCVRTKRGNRLLRSNSTSGVNVDDEPLLLVAAGAYNTTDTLFGEVSDTESEPSCSAGPGISTSGGNSAVVLSTSSDRPSTAAVPSTNVPSENTPSADVEDGEITDSDTDVTGTAAATNHTTVANKENTAVPLKTGKDLETKGGSKQSEKDRDRNRKQLRDQSEHDKCSKSSSRTPPRKQNPSGRKRAASPVRKNRSVSDISRDNSRRSSTQLGRNRGNADSRKDRPAASSSSIKRDDSRGKLHSSSGRVNDSRSGGRSDRRPSVGKGSVRPRCVDQTGTRSVNSRKPSAGSRLGPARKF